MFIAQFTLSIRAAHGDLVGGGAFVLQMRRLNLPSTQIASRWQARSDAARQGSH